MLLALRELPQVEAVAGAFTAPYENASWGTGIKVRGKQYRVRRQRGHRPISRCDQSEWSPAAGSPAKTTACVGPGDDQPQPGPRDLRQFEPGRPGIPEDPEPGDKDMSPEDRERVGREMRVVGVIEDFRQHGELSRPEPFMFHRMRLDDPTKGAPRELLLKVRRGTTAAFEETLVKQMQAAAHDWSFEVQETAALRRRTCGTI